MCFVQIKFLITIFIKILFILGLRVPTTLIVGQVNSITCRETFDSRTLLTNHYQGGGDHFFPFRLTETRLTMVRVSRDGPDSGPFIHQFESTGPEELPTGIE